MAFTEAQLLAQIETGTGLSTGHVFQVLRFVDDGNSSTDLYLMPVASPYAGRPARWLKVAQSNTAAQAWAAIQAAFA